MNKFEKRAREVAESYVDDWVEERPAYNHHFASEKLRDFMEGALWAQDELREEIERLKAELEMKKMNQGRPNTWEYSILLQKLIYLNDSKSGLPVSRNLYFDAILAEIRQALKESE